MSVGNFIIRIWDFRFRNWGSTSYLYLINLNNLELMKVFISWSGTKSHKVALVFRDWLPSVIQSIEPYVSSEDIDKGARWSSDIAKELENSTYGILCVTKENFEAPWLSFEAGALSKTMDKSFVSPFLFDIKRSEVKGPILQFQSTVFEKDDIKKLLNGLNKAYGENSIPDARLEMAFEVWYPKLEEALNKVSDIKNEPDDAEKKNSHSHSAEILEEILDLSRNNQKLLRNPELKIDDFKNLIQDQFRSERSIDIDNKRMLRRLHPMFIDELLHMSNKNIKTFHGFLITLSLFRGEFPWLYDAGKELIDVIKSKNSQENKIEALDSFREMMDFTFNHPMMREMYGNRKDSGIYMKEIPYMLINHLEELLNKS